MRNLVYTNSFKKDYKRESKGRFRHQLNDILTAVIDLLMKDKPLPENLRDHNLTGNWADHRECHLKPDLLLIYRKSDDNLLQLVRLGSHSKLGF